MTARTDHEDWMDVPVVDADLSVAILEDWSIELAIGEDIYLLTPHDAQAIGTRLMAASILSKRKVRP